MTPRDPFAALPAARHSRLIECATPMTCCGSKFNWPGIRLFTARVKGHRRHCPRAGRLPGNFLAASSPSRCVDQVSRIHANTFLKPGHAFVAGLVRVVDGEHDGIGADFQRRESPNRSGCSATNLPGGD
jgi:hypothetical protein